MSGHELLELLRDKPPEGAHSGLFVVKTRSGKEVVACRSDIRPKDRLDFFDRAWLDAMEGATLLHRHIRVVSIRPFRWEPAEHLKSSLDGDETII